MNADLFARFGAVVAGLATLVVPALVAAIKPKTTSMTDAHTVLEIASRLKAQGCVKGVELCQQLIDVMVSGEKQ